MKKLSICIATYNRSGYLYETLSCLQKQLEPSVEIIIVDGASTDDTSNIAQLFTAKTDAIRYFRETENSGVDRDFDKAVKYAMGEYCWLFSDDDLLVIDAVSHILKAIDDGHELLVVNSSIYTKEMNYVLAERVLQDTHDQEFIREGEQAFGKLGNYLSFIGAIIVKRDYWLSRERETYHGSEFAHIGVLFQSPSVPRVKLVSRPLIMIRYGNSQWANRGFEVWIKQWPGIINKLSGISPETRDAVSNVSFFAILKFCCLYRAMGVYDLKKYYSNFETRPNVLARAVLKLIACIPSKSFNALLAIVILFTGGSRINVYRLASSSSATKTSNWVARLRGLM